AHRPGHDDGDHQGAEPPDRDPEQPAAEREEQGGVDGEADRREDGRHGSSLPLPTPPILVGCRSPRAWCDRGPAQRRYAATLPVTTGRPEAIQAPVPPSTDTVW